MKRLQTCFQSQRFKRQYCEPPSDIASNLKSRHYIRNRGRWGMGRTLVYLGIFLVIPGSCLALYNLLPDGDEGDGNGDGERDDVRFAVLFTGLLVPGGAVLWLALAAIPGVVKLLQVPARRLLKTCTQPTLNLLLLILLCILYASA